MNSSVNLRGGEGGLHIFYVSNPVYILRTVSGLGISPHDFDTVMCLVTDVCLTYYQPPCITSALYTHVAHSCKIPADAFIIHET